MEFTLIPNMKATTHEATKTNKPVAIAIQKLFENRSLLLVYGGKSHHDDCLDSKHEEIWGQPFKHVNAVSKDTILNNSFTFWFIDFVFMRLSLQCIAQESLVWVPWGHISHRLMYFIEKVFLAGWVHQWLIFFNHLPIIWHCTMDHSFV